MGSKEREIKDEAFEIQSDRIGSYSGQLIKRAGIEEMRTLEMNR